MLLKQSSEHQEQAAVISWIKEYHPDWLAIHIENEYNPKSNQKKKYEMGFIKGFPDLMIIMPNKTVFIEMKKKKGGRVSTHQKDVIKNLNELGHSAIVAHGASEAIKFLATHCNPQICL